MTTTDAFVPETAVQFEHFVESTDQQAFQIKLGRDPHIHVHPQRVVTRFERLRSCTSGNVLKHRSFHFDEVPLVQESTNLGYHQAALAKDFATALVGNQVQVALAIFDLRIDHAVIFVRQWAQ